MQFIKRWIYWHNFELGFIVNTDLWIVFCDKFWSADLMAHTPTHEWQVSLQSTYTWILYTLWTLLSYVKINIEYPVSPSCFQVLPPSLYTKLSNSSRRTFVVTTARIRPHFCVIHINIISLHKLTHCVRDNIYVNICVLVVLGIRFCSFVVFFFFRYLFIYGLTHCDLGRHSASHKIDMKWSFQSLFSLLKKTCFNWELQLNFQRNVHRCLL